MNCSEIDISLPSTAPSPPSMSLTSIFWRLSQKPLESANWKTSYSLWTTELTTFQLYKRHLIYEEYQYRRTSQQTRSIPYPPLLCHTTANAPPSCPTQPYAQSA
jgi:hypothetical protein